MGKAERCDNCRFGVESTMKDQYNHPVPIIKCRYNPPSVFLDSRDVTITRFPRLNLDSWCSKWETAVTEEVIAETKEWTDQ
jgi:hypothetical protein